MLHVQFDEPVHSGVVTDIVDIGANLTNKAFRSDLDGVLERASAAGVRPIVVTGTSVDASQAAVELARTRPGLLYATAGIHPHHARTFGPLAHAALRELAARAEVVALGECGLDYNRNYSPAADQLVCFEAQLELAAELGLPLFLHERDAHEPFARLIERWRPRLSRAVVHCFTGTAAELERYLELDLHIGITGWICDERRGQELKQLVGRIPAERLMIETDAPYLLPRDLSPKPSNGCNEPAFLRHVLSAVAGCRNEPVEAVARATTATATAFFELEPGSAQNHLFGGGT
jgi:TatD DNase family protein